MKQVFQSARSGDVILSEVPPPQVRSNGILVETVASLISPGTERATLEFSQKNLLQKAKSRPDLVKQVKEKVKRDGFLEAARTVFARLDQPIPMGYSSSGIVIAKGTNASEFHVGDRVACGGVGYGGHAEINYVPRNLAVLVPQRNSGELIPFQDASFATIGAIALHGVRLGKVRIGDRVAVIGLGLVGLLASQILRAHGATVLGVEPNPIRRTLGERLGIESTCSPEQANEQVRSFTNGLGADLVIIAAASSNSGPVELAGDIARDRAKVVAVGATGLKIPRRTFYQKELSFVVSRSYGPGRYDSDFEERGINYPPGYVRWTERENMRAFLELLATDRITVEPLISRRVNIEDVKSAYQNLDDPKTLGIVLQYGEWDSKIESSILSHAPRIELNCKKSIGNNSVGISFIGAGQFAQGVLLPILSRMPHVNLRGVVTGNGASARWVGDKFNFQFCSSDPNAVWSDRETHAVVIATRNHLHAEFVQKTMEVGKSVFVEKPLCVAEDELEGLIKTHRDMSMKGTPLIMVGFNRRFSPLTHDIRAFFKGLGNGLALTYRINAGRLPEGSWVSNPLEGGGRIISEVCHFVDLASFLIDSRPVSVFAQGGWGGDDNLSVSLRYANDSLAVIGYYSNGDRAYSKEWLELMGSGGISTIDDFRTGILMRNGKRRKIGKRLKQQKGHFEELSAFVEALINKKPNPVPFEESVLTTRTTFAILNSLSLGIPIDLVS